MEAREEEQQEVTVAELAQEAPLGIDRFRRRPGHHRETPRAAGESHS